MNLKHIDGYVETLMDHKYQEDLQLEDGMNRLAFEIQLLSVLLLIVTVQLLWLTLPLNLPWLFTLLAGSIICGLFLAALVTASVIRLWPRVTSFPDYTAIRSRIRNAQEPGEQFEEYMDMLDGAAQLSRKSLKKKRAVLMAAQICLYAAIACVVAAFVTGLCLWL